MLPSKFCVFKTDRILNNASKFPFYIHHLNFFDKAPRPNPKNKWSNNILKHRPNPYDTCKRNAEELVRYLKKVYVQQRYVKQKPLNKCKTLTIVEEYEEARKEVNDTIGRLTQFFNEEKEAIMESLKKEAKFDKDDACRWLKNISESIDEKLQHLIQLDSCFGSEIRITVLRFKDQARNAFINLHYELMPSVKQIESMLEKIQNEISQCIQESMILTLVSRCNGSSSVFKKCLLDNTKEAKNILDRKMQETQLKVNDVKKLRDYVLKCHKDALNEETNNHFSKMQILSQYLDNCLTALKEQRK